VPKRKIEEIFKPKFWLNLSKSESKKHKPFLSPTVWDTMSKDYDDLEESEFYKSLKADVLSEMERRGAIESNYSVIDVCCGTGSYTVEFAKRVKEVLAIDISQGMLEQLKKKLEKLSLKNVEVICEDWYKFNTDRSFDTVFVSMTPVLGDLEQIDRFLNISKRYLVIVHWAGLRKNELLEEISQKFFKKTYKASSPGIVLIFNYLFSKGWAPDLKFYHGYFERKGSVERVWERFKTRLMAKGYRISAKKEKDVLNFLEDKSKDGIIEYKTKVRIGALFLNKEVFYGKSRNDRSGDDL